MMQLSRSHTFKYCLWALARQAQYAADRGAAGGLLPELFCFERGEVVADPRAAAAASAEALAQLQVLAKKFKLYLGTSLVEGGESEGAACYYHTAYLVGQMAETGGREGVFGCALRCSMWGLSWCLLWCL